MIDERRAATRRIYIGGIAVGGGSEVSVQSMTNTDTRDVDATAEQVGRLADAGCQIVRLAVPDMSAVRAFEKIRQRSPVPLVADIHFDHKLAIASVDAGADKIRINPGNIGGAGRVRDIVKVCRKNSVPIRVGVNGGSLDRDITAKYGDGAEALVESALKHIALLNSFDFYDICVSIKSSNVVTTVRAYRLMSQRCDYPLHLGVTEAGGERAGTVKSSVGIGSLLLSGIGDTIRVSLTADPVTEVRVGLEILRAAGLRKCGAQVISCPTCGRCRIDLAALAGQVESRLEGCKSEITVAVMGCAVNGPGEARHADVGVAGGDGYGLLFKRGEAVGRVAQDKIVDALMELVAEITEKKG